MDSKAIEFLKAHESSRPSQFMERAEWRRKNATWLKRSRQVALAMTRYMQEEGLSKNDMAEQLGVTEQEMSQMLSGSQNFSLSNIAEIEEKLGIECMAYA